ncbi:MAG: penicillin acylase family protein [Omnitrophica WOR_2 bacterium]
MIDFTSLFTPVLNLLFKQLSLIRRPKIKGSIKIPGNILHAPVEVFYDRWGVPHIYAGDVHDLMFAQGYVHAQQRLWQMDFNRRLVAGRLSEIIGESTVEVDRWMRIIGMRCVVERDVNLIDAETRVNLEAYSFGVNSYIELEPLPIEFTLLRYKPEPWTMADSVSWGKMMSWYLSVNWESELLRAQIYAKLGPEKAAELEPVYFDYWPVIQSPGVDYSKTDRSALERAKNARSYTGPSAKDGLGSNSWVVSGSRTDSGKPILANDMHLAMGLPSIWFENHLVAPGWNVTGVTFPGIPGVVAGHNDRIAWGFTNGFADVQDLYMERLRETEDGNVQYEYQGAWLDATIVQEEIRVKGSQPVIEKVVITRHGPIINQLAPDHCGSQSLALKWTSHEHDNMANAILQFDTAKNYDEFRKGLQFWTAPIENIVYADVDGNIAYNYPGKIPIRRKGNGSIPVPGWTGEYEWDGYIPYDELPSLLNPEAGFIATANNRVVDDSFPYFIGREFIMGDRAERIVELIQAKDKVNVDYVKSMQFDQSSSTARRIGKFMAGICSDDPGLAPIIDLMKTWNGEITANSRAAAIYEVFMRRMIELTLAARLGDYTIHYMGKGPTPVLAEGSILGQFAWEWIMTELEKPDSTWFDQGQGETRDMMVQAALKDTIQYLTSRLGPKLEDWEWGKLHSINFKHILGQAKPLDRIFNRGPYPLGGDFNTIWATGSSQHSVDIGPVIGPPFRIINDLSDLNHSLGLLAPGNSGLLGSRHYDDQIQDWFKAGYHIMLFDRMEVEEAARHKLKLIPAQGSQDEEFQK